MKAPLRKSKLDVGIIEKAEKILNRTLAYQAAIAVHDLKDTLGLDVKELSLVVAPLSNGAPGVYRVTCTIANLATPDPVVIDLVVVPGMVVASSSKEREAD